MDAPAWNIESEYPSLASTEFERDFQTANKQLDQLDGQITSLKEKLAKDPQGSVPTIQEAFVLHEQASILISNMRTYLQCTLSVNATDQAARAKLSEIETCSSRANQIIMPLRIFLKRCDESVFRSITEHPTLKGYTFSWEQERSLAPHLLPEGEEILLEALSVPGHIAWGNLYETLSGTVKCHLRYPDRTETVGLAQAHALTYGADEPVRKVAWHAIQETWTEHRESAAAVLNSLAAWRHEVCRRRSHKKESHFLDQPLFDNRISRPTLDAMLAACRNNLADLQAAPRLMAKIMGKPQLDPWDLVSSSPVSASPKAKSYKEGLDLIRSAFSGVDAGLADFVTMMEKNRWLEGRVLPNKRTGAYCTEFAKSMEPRVYQTYMGSLSDVTTLAHELGHAFHSWSIRDLPRGEQSYPMTLAETASVFAETVLRDALLEKATDHTEKLEFAWGDIEAMTAFLLNIPTRFEFENNFYEQRRHRTLSADELSELMNAAWTNWYGPTLSQNDKLFWAHKLHFSIAELSFYNFPYTFGYLFSLSIYARRAELGSRFMPTYLNILRDTGRMRAEDLVRKHLDEDISRPEFWQKGIDVVKAKLNRFSTLV